MWNEALWHLFYYHTSVSNLASFQVRNENRIPPQQMKHANKYRELIELDISQLGENIWIIVKHCLLIEVGVERYDRTIRSREKQKTWGSRGRLLVNADYWCLRKRVLVFINWPNQALDVCDWSTYSSSSTTDTNVSTGRLLYHSSGIIYNAC